jgi:molybdopterin molybdotransferase
MMDIRMRGFPHLTDIDEAVALITKDAMTLGTEVVDLQDALGRVCGKDVLAGRHIPIMDRSAMDGFAVVARDTWGSSTTNPLRLSLIGEASAGEFSKLAVAQGHAVRIMTGAWMPGGADAVVMAEYADVDGSDILVRTAVTPGKNVAKKGEDLMPDSVAVQEGARLRPEHIGLLSLLGEASVEAYRRPRLAVISTGNEISESGERRNDWQITDANAPLLSTLCRISGADCVYKGVVRDDLQMLLSSIGSAKEDMIIITGGSSVGEHDLVPKAVATLGKILVHGIAMRPGAPTGFGMIGKRPVFMLPGNPVAVYFAFRMLVRPCISVMQGVMSDHKEPTLRCRLKRKIASQAGRTEFVRVRIEGDIADPIRTGGAGVLSSLTRADGFVIIEKNLEGLDAQAEVEVHIL